MKIVTVALILLLFLGVQLCAGFHDSEKRMRGSVRRNPHSQDAVLSVETQNMRIRIKELVSLRTVTSDVEEIVDQIMDMVLSSVNCLNTSSTPLSISDSTRNEGNPSAEWPTDQEYTRALNVQLSDITTEQWLSILGCVICVICAACAAGLTLGLMSFETLDLELKMNAGSPVEQRQAKAILPLLSNSHRLLVTLLLFNSVANEAMPIFLDDLVPEYMAVIISVTLVLIFGEVIPSAIFMGPRKLAIVSKLTWLVKFLLVIFAVLAWPLGWVLDKLLGHEAMKKYTRDELLHLVTLHHKAEIIARERVQSSELRADSGSFKGKIDEKTPLTESMRSLHKSCRMGRDYGLTEDEVDIMQGAMKSVITNVIDIMVPLKNVYSLPIEQKMDFDTMAEIMASGYSRVLIYRENDESNICGFLLVKKLIVLDPEDARPIEPEWLKTPICVEPQMSVLELLNRFQEGHSHIALVSYAPNNTEQEMKDNEALSGASRPIGIVTLEDIIETIIQEEVMDETSMMEKKANQMMMQYIRKTQEKKKMNQMNGSLNHN